MSIKLFMKKMPRTLRIGPLDWTVRLMTGAEQMGGGNIGLCEPSHQRLNVQENPASTHSAVDTLLHEISHAIFWVFHVRGGDSEERIVSAMGTAWTQIYRDNPDLLDWIAEGVGHA